MTGPRIPLRARLTRASVAAGLVVVLASGCAAAGGLVGVKSPPTSPVPGAALEPQQARGIVGRVLAAANAADRSRNVST
jgi:hypothetical protein